MITPTVMSALTSATSGPSRSSEGEASELPTVESTDAEGGVDLAIVPRVKIAGTFRYPPAATQS